MATQAGSWRLRTDSGHALRILTGSCTLTSGAISLQKGAGITVSKTTTGEYALTFVNPGYACIFATVNYEKTTVTTDFAEVKSKSGTAVSFFTQSGGVASQIDGIVNYFIVLADSDVSP